MNELYANVIVDVKAEALNKPFVFKVGKELSTKIRPGDKVIFPFGKGNKEREGFVLELLTIDQLKNKKFYKKEKYFRDKNAIKNLKTLIKKADNKIGINEILLKISIFLCKEYYAPIISCLNTVIPIKKQIRKNKRQSDVIEKYKVNEKEKKIKNEIKLNTEQSKIVNAIVKEHKKGKFDEHLVYGITGSGKTEVYIKVIEEVLKEKKKVIVLIPEIALTHQTVIRLKEKFDENIAIIHSRMSAGDRYIQYKKCEDGEVSILVGPRSAIFAPFLDLGLVVIDEVNDSSYKSETAPRYDTLDVARYRCMEQRASLVTLSATPKVTHYYEAKEGKNIHLHTLTKRAVSLLPKVTIVDMKKEVKEGNKTLFSRLLKEKIEEKLAKKEQIMLFMNRRGYDTIFTCKTCGETYKCPHCDVALVSHYDGKMRCHYCGYEVREPMACPTCGGTEIEKYGIGTEKLEALCIELFPDARILRMDKDTTKEKDAHDTIIEKFKNHEADILIGTQMIVKGHDFPLVTLVAVIRADLTLYTQDYKASENTYSMLTQCVGRSGRASLGESIIQAYDVDNYAIKQTATDDYSKFYENEIKYRKKLNYPPYSYILYIKLSSANKVILSECANNLKMFLNMKNDNDATILGPTVANPEKIKDIYSMYIYVKCKDKIIAKIYRKLTTNFIDYKYEDEDISVIYDIE